MEIHRTKPSPGLTLRVTAEGPEVLIYKVARNGKPEGEGRMALVENGKAWVDISWPTGHPRQRASNGDMLELPSAVLAVKDVRAVRIVGKYGNDIERLRGLSGH